MNADQWARVAATFDAVREQPENQRSAYLDTHCPDTSMRAEVLAMLQAYDRDPAFLEPTTEIAGAVAQSLATGLVGRRVGAYRLIREIGRGGMGLVWLAERADGSFKRQVALKLPRLVWGAGLAERMARERDIGALLEHPNIARLYDAGVDSFGRPYLALEYIDGRPRQ